MTRLLGYGGHRYPSRALPPVTPGSEDRQRPVFIFVTSLAFDMVILGWILLHFLPVLGLLPFCFTLIAAILPTDEDNEDPGGMNQQFS